MMLCTVGRRLVDRGAGKVIYSQMIKCLSEKNLEPKETYWSWGKDVDNSFKQMPTEPSTTIGTIVGKHVWTGFAFFFFFLEEKQNVEVLRPADTIDICPISHTCWL